MINGTKTYLDKSVSKLKGNLRINYNLTQTMKTAIQLLLLLFTIALMACKEEKGVKETTSEKTSPENKSTYSGNEKVVVQNYKVYTGNELNDWLPEKIIDYVKMEPSTIGEEGFHHIAANYHYKAGYDKYITLEITNGQSDKDLKVKKSITQKIEMNFAENTESGYTKVYNRKGVDVFEMQSDYKNSATIEFIVNQRFYIRVKGANLKAEEVWQFIEQLDFNKLQ